MEDSIQDHVNKRYFSDLYFSFLGNKKIEVKLKARTQDYTLKANAHSKYNFKKETENFDTDDYQEYTFKQAAEIGNFKLVNKWSPYNQDKISNEIYYKSNAGTLGFLHKTSRNHLVNKLVMRHYYNNHGLRSKVDFGFNQAEESLEAALFGTYNFKLNLPRRGSLKNQDFELKAFELLYSLETDDYDFVVSHLLDDPQLENLIGKFTVGLVKKHSSRFKSIVKLSHDYETKDSQIDLVLHSQITKHTILRNRVNSKYSLGTCLTYKINDNIQLTHSAEIDLKRFFKNREDYKYGFGIEISL